MSVQQRKKTKQINKGFDNIYYIFAYGILKIDFIIC